MAAQKDLLSTQGVKQGYIHFPFLFVLTIDWVMRKCTHDNRSIKRSEAAALQDWDFADDLALLCYTFDDQQNLRGLLAQSDSSLAHQKPNP